MAKNEEKTCPTSLQIKFFRNVVGWEIIAHELPELKHLNFVFIGDECPLAELPKDFTYKSKEIQQNRKNDELRIRYILVDKLYQDYAKNNAYIPPDFVVALDCGFKFYPSWNKAIPQMVRHGGAAMIFTEFTQTDCEDNLDIGKVFFIEKVTNTYYSGVQNGLRTF